MATSKETSLIDTLTTVAQTSPEYSNLPPEAKLFFDSALKESLETNSSQYVNQVEQESNLSLNEIPKNLVGSSNPVNVVSGNLSANQLKGTLNDSVGEKLNVNISKALASDIFGRFKNKLPIGLKAVVDLPAFQIALSDTTSAGVGKGVDNLIGSYSSGVLSGRNKINPVVNDVESYFEKGLDEVNKQYDSSLSSQALREAQNFNVKNPENQEKLVTQNQGFIDPTATYPTKEYAGRPETNKLAQGEVSGTVVQQKENDRLKGIQLPDGQSWEQPRIPFKGEYPYNKVIETESGHIIEIDDTPGVERLHVYHKSGTFIEIDSTGSVVKKTKGSSYEIVDKNGYISVTGDANLSVKGSIKIYVGGDANIEVDGDTNVKCHNDITMQAAGRVDISASEEINLHSANINIEADVNLNIKSDNDTRVSAGGKMYHKANSTIYHESLDGYNVKAVNDINVDSDAEVHLNSDRAVASEFALNANIGILGPRKDIILETIQDPIPPNYLDKFGYTAEDSEQEIDAVNQAKELKLKGIASEDQLNENQIPVETDNPTSSVTTIVPPDQFLLGQTYLPDSYQLSKHFTLAQVSSKAVVSNYPVVAQLGLTYGQIVYNLQGVALNVLEPLLALYPNMFVTSGFRAARNSSTTSDHPRGKAVDIQFKNVTKADYYNIARKLATNLVYDKLLLEYKTYGTGLPWIHISFDVERPRKLVLTYLNDKKYGSGLTNLA